MINLPPADLDAFIAVAETGSFRLSADKLGVSQPTISARVRHLEALLGVSLFHRTTRRVTITEAGERLRGRVERMVLETRELLAEFREEAHLKRGRLTVGASPSVGASFLPAALGEFRRRHPGISIELLDDFYGQELDRISRGEADLAVSPFVSGEDSFRFDLLFEDVFLLAVPADHRFAALESVAIGEITAETIISMPPESAAWATVRRAFTSAGHDFTPALMTRYSVTLLSLVRAGLGIGLVTDMICRSLDMQGIRLLPVTGADLTRRIGIVTARHRRLTPAAEAFRQILLRRTSP
jgi:DNA-binding transcriptional LysR family regulator